MTMFIYAKPLASRHKHAAVHRAVCGMPSWLAEVGCPIIKLFYRGESIDGIDLMEGGVWYISTPA